MWRLGFINCGSVSAGRQVKMAFVNSVAKPPRDVRRRQEKFGTTSGSSSAASITAASPIKSVLCYLTCATVLTFTVLQGALSQTAQTALSSES